MICRHFEEHFQHVAPNVDWNNTTDTFKAGNPEQEVTTIAVAWKATWDALRIARSIGAQLFITHESLCVQADNTDPSDEVVFALPSEMPKFEWLAETGMTVFRCHDTWDRFPDIGVRWSWQKGLGLGSDVVVDAYPLLVTEIAPLTVGELAQNVLEKVRPLGQNGIAVWGDLEKIVRRVATGTGVTVDPIAMVDKGAEVGICTDDNFRHVRAGAHAIELGFPGIVVNHGVSEEWGIAALARYLSETFPSIEVVHLPQQCAYTVVT